MRMRIVCSAGVLIALGACVDHATSPAITPEDHISAARAPSIPVVPLRVSVSSTDADGNAYGIRSDGLGAYVDGLQGVEARLDAYGTFVLNFSAKKGSASRWVSYDFNNPVDPSNLYRPTPSIINGYHFSTGGSQFSPSIPIQNLGINGNPSSQCMYMGNSVTNGSASWRVSFHKGSEDTSDSPTSYAVVTRTSVTPATWTIAPVGACSPASNVASLRSSDGSVLYGYYYLPFLFTLSLK